MNVIYGYLLLPLLSNFAYTCLDNCSCENDVLHCHGNGIPASIPNNVTKIFLQSFDLDNLKQHQFEDISWRKVKTLDISADSGKSLQFKSEMFKGLDSLETLGIHGKDLESINKQLFSELSRLNITTLDLSGNRKLPLEHVTAAISNQYGFSILPKLENLTIANLYRYSQGTNPVTLSRAFFKSVAWRKSVKYLDLSDLNIASLDYNYMYLLCDVTEHVKLQRSTIGRTIQNVNSTCASLRTYDLSDTSMPWIVPGKYKTDKGNTFHCRTVSFFYDVRNLILNRIFTKYLKLVELGLTKIDVSKCPFAVQSVQLTGNHFKDFNFTGVIHQATQESLQELDFSDNVLEYISPGAFSSSTNLQNLSLCGNKLYLMQEKYREDFIKLFNSMPNLRYLYLSNNRLTNIPRYLFLNNSRLLFLDLSNNKLSSITFKLDHMKQLEFLKVSGNEIKTVEDVTRWQFEALYNLNQMQVDFSNNPFECLCDTENVKLIKWIKTSQVVYRQNKGAKYACSLDGKHVDILKSAIEETEQFCRLQQQLHLISIVVTTVAGVFLAVGGTVIVLIRRNINRKKYGCVLKNIQNGVFPYKFLVFLSFCNEDFELVFNKVRPQLKKTIHEMTKSNEELIGIGDLCFRPGFTIHNESMKCIEKSAVVIFFVSNTFCQKNWCQMEVEEAYAQHKPIILLMLEKVKKEYMSPFLRKIFNRYTHASWINDTNGGHIEPNWNILCESIVKLACKDQSENTETVTEFNGEYHRLDNMNLEV